MKVPAEDSEHEVEHEEGADDDEWHEVQPRKEAPHGVIALWKSWRDVVEELGRSGGRVVKWKRVFEGFFGWRNLKIPIVIKKNKKRDFEDKMARS